MGGGGEGFLRDPTVLRSSLSFLLDAFLAAVCFNLQLKGGRQIDLDLAATNLGPRSRPLPAPSTVKASSAQHGDTGPGKIYAAD